jgi:hypothetical protein
MAAQRYPGSLSQPEHPILVEDGTSPRFTMPMPDSTGAPPGVPMGDLMLGILNRRRQGFIHDAWDRAVDRYVPNAIKTQTMEEFRNHLQGHLDSVLLFAGRDMKRTGPALVIGGVGGSFVNGSDATAARTAAAQVGMVLAHEMLGWWNAQFLLEYVIRGLHEVGEDLAAGMRTAWESDGQEAILDQAARRMADGVGQFCRLLLQAVTLYITDSAGGGKSFTQRMAPLRESRLFKLSPKLEVWLADNYTAILGKYNLPADPRIRPRKTAVPATHILEAQVAARALISAMLEGSRIKFRSVTELDRAIRSRGFQLLKNDAWGPSEPNARQLVYQGDKNIVARVKTRGDAAGLRASKPTMTVEVTDGRGTSPENVLFKVDAEGKIVAKALVGHNQVVETAEGYKVVGPDGRVRNVSGWEVLEAGGVKPADKEFFAERGYLDFPEGFEVKGAEQLK